jgi:predicted amidohydrolase
LLALPEYFAIMGMRDDDKVRLREVDGHGPIQDFLAAKAREHGIWLIGGSLPLSRPSIPTRCSIRVWSTIRRGARVARYDKIHLFGFRQGTERYDERATIEAGRQPVSFDAPFGRVGLSICYDLSFPELYRAFGVTELLVIPAAFTETTGRAHWEILLRARAIENQCYVLAVAQGGKSRERPRDARQQHAHRPLGEYPRPQAERTRHRHRRPRTTPPRRSPHQPAGARRTVSCSFRHPNVFAANMENQ